MAQQQQQQQRVSPHEEMLRAFQAAGQEDRHWLVRSDEEALLYAIGVATGDLDPTTPLEEQTGKVIDLTAYTRRDTGMPVIQPRLIGG